jgi:hypothetical protein
MNLLSEVAANLDGVVYDGLTADKVRTRGCVLESTDEVIILEVERHKRASGANYREGFPMSAYVTYWPCYRFNRDSGELEELDERRPREFECSSYRRLAEELMGVGFNLSVCAEGEEWICQNPVSNAETVVEGLEDVKDFAEQQVRGWDLEEVYGWELKEILGEQRLDEHFTKLEKALVAEARKQAERAWEMR